VKQSRGPRKDSRRIMTGPENCLESSHIGEAAMGQGGLPPESRPVPEVTIYCSGAFSRQCVISVRETVKPPNGQSGSGVSLTGRSTTWRSAQNFGGRSSRQVRPIRSIPPRKPGKKKWRIITLYRTPARPKKGPERT